MISKILVQTDGSKTAGKAAGVRIVAGSPLSTTEYEMFGDVDHLREYMPPQKKLFHLRCNYIAAFVRSMIVLGVIGKERFHYWRLLLWTVFARPRLLPQAVTLSIYGFHFRKVFEKRLG